VDPVANTWEQVPHVNASDTNPLWVGKLVVFISDRNDGAANLYVYDPQTKALQQLTKETVWDVRSARAAGDTVVYEVGGHLKEINVATGVKRDLVVNVAAQAVQTRPQWKDASSSITSARLSATGKRVVVSARGDVFTVPVKDGSVRNLTQTSGVREKDALWSPDGKKVAYISDAGMHHVLMLHDQNGLDKPQSLELGKEGYFTLLDWSPDGKFIVYNDNHLHLYVIALDKGVVALVDNRKRRGPFNVSISQDSRWLAYNVSAENYFSRIRIRDLTNGATVDATDGLSHADNPVFAGTDYLYFTSSINTGPSQVGLDMSSQERPVRDGIYALVLAANGKSPIAPLTGDENEKTEKSDKLDKAEKADKAVNSDKGTKDDKKDALPKLPKPVRIDFEGLQQRVVALPVPEQGYDSLAVSADGSLWYLETRAPGVRVDAPDFESSGSNDLVRFSFEDRKPKTMKQNLQSFSLSADGKKILLQFNKGKLEISDAVEKMDTKTIDTAQVGMVIDPRQEWQQIFDETWWMEKEYFYDANLHGLDWNAVRTRYQSQLQYVQRREDLNELLREMIGELKVGHNRVGGGDVHREKPVATGLLGADFAVENDRYRIKTIYAADRWNPFMKSPLAVPGLGVREGDYLLAINGQALSGKQNLYSLLENTVGKQVTLTVATDASGKESHNVVVQPISSETALRQWNWIERNRQTVEKATDGMVAYVYLPDTGGEGYKHFNRMFFAQADKAALIVDDRRNGGGQAANYIIDVLLRPYLSGWKDRDGLVFDTPGGAIYGPKVMLIDQDAGSGGDFLPYAFKRTGLGPLIGKRTWGGLIGISANPSLIDGGNLVVPFFRFYTPEREWRVENEGVAPDMDVELDPTAVNKGRDTQLEAAIQSVMLKLKVGKSTRVSPPPPATLGK
jgi:tricorn protease